MSDILCVTNRALCTEDFFTRLQKLAGAHPCGIILREKDLSEYAYYTLARRALEICERYDTPLILHSFPAVAEALQCERVHIPLPVLRKTDNPFPVLGTSCHSLDEALEAEALGCTYITVGHIFDTDCKAGLPGRGLDFLQSVCEAVTIPVYAIGGIRPDNIAAVRACGASGACIMQSAMRCADVRKLLAELEEKHEI